MRIPRKKVRRARRRGAAMLVVLMVTMMIMVLSMGFIARSDTELACGDNTALRLKMDNLARWAIEYGRVYTINLGPSSIPDSGARLSESGSRDYWECDFKPLGVGTSVPVANPADPNLFAGADTCTYTITAKGYRVINSVRVAQSTLEAKILYVNVGNQEGLYHFHQTTIISRPPRLSARPDNRNRALFFCPHEIHSMIFPEFFRLAPFSCGRTDCIDRADWTDLSPSQTGYQPFPRGLFCLNCPDFPPTIPRQSDERFRFRD